MSFSTGINLSDGRHPVELSCYTYAYSNPILNIRAAGCHTTISVGRYRDPLVSDDDLAAARALLAAAQTFVDDLVAKYAAQAAPVEVAS